MTAESFPSSELIEVIKGQARLEEKLDSFIRTQTTMQTEVRELDHRVTKLENKGIRREAFVAGAGSIGGAGLTFLAPYLKAKLGL